MLRKEASPSPRTFWLHSYWVIVALWLIVLVAVGMAYVRNPRTFGAARLLLVILAVDTARNVIENLYFGLYFGAQYARISVR